MLSYLDVGLEKRVRVILLEELLVPLVIVDDPGLKWRFSDVDFLERFYLFHLWLGIWIVPFHGRWHFFCILSLRVWISDASTSSAFTMSATMMSPFQIPPACNACPRNMPGKTFGPNWCSRDRSLAAIGWHLTIAPNGISVEGHSEPPSCGVFPSDKRSCSKGFDSSICDWTNKFSFIFGKYYFFCIGPFRADFRCAHRLQLLNVCKPVRHPSKFSPRTEQIQGTIQVRLSFQINGFLTGLSQK